MNPRLAQELARLRGKLDRADEGLAFLARISEARKLTKVETDRRLRLDDMRKSLHASLVKLEVLAKAGKL